MARRWLADITTGLKEQLGESDGKRAELLPQGERVPRAEVPLRRFNQLVAWQRVARARSRTSDDHRQR